MKILVTGATGFLGYHLMKVLAADTGFQVLGLTRDLNHARAIKLQRLIENARQSSHLICKKPSLFLQEVDLRDIASLEVLLKQFEPEVVVHLAWSGVYNHTHQDLLQYENIEITKNLITLAKRYGMTTFIGLGSQAEYGPQNKKLTELDLLLPQTLYGKAKVETSVITKKLCEEANVRWMWLRLFSTYGPLDDPRWLIPYVIVELSCQRNPKLTHGEQLWDYLYIEDAAHAVLSCIKSTLTGVFNIGSGRTYKIQDIIKVIHKQMNSSIELIFGEVPLKEGSLLHLEADISKIAASTPWIPLTSLDEGLKQAINSMLTPELAST